MKISMLSVLSVLVFLAAPAFCAERPGMPGPPMAASPTRGAHALVIGPADASGAPRPVSGKLVILANVPKEIQAAQVELFFDEKSIGTANSKPYKVEFDCSSIADGEHLVKAVGHDNDGEQVWTASTKVRVTNNGAVKPETPTVQPEPAPSASDIVPAPVPAIPPAAQPRESIVNPLELESIYTSKHGFSIKHPVGWAVKDETAKMKSKAGGEFWLAFGASPVVVNIHRSRLAPSTNAEVFAKYNPYVQSWVRKAVSNSPAFVITEGKPDMKRVVHRVIFIKDGSAWMANCIDTTGGPSATTAKLLEDMLETLQVKSGSGVTITPMK